MEAGLEAGGFNSEERGLAVSPPPAAPLQSADPGRLSLGGRGARGPIHPGVRASSCTRPHPAGLVPAVRGAGPAGS